MSTGAGTSDGTRGRVPARLTPLRLALTAPSVALAVGLIVVSPPLGAFAALAVLADVLVTYLPWRLPRRARSATSYWAETLVYLLPATAAAAVAAFEAPEVYARPDAVWFAAAIAAGGLLVVMSGVSVRGVIAGDLAFLSGPDRSSDAAARATALAATPVGEEALFRGIVLPLGDPSAGLVVLSGVAFVTRHHLIPGLPRASGRQVLVEALATILFLGLALGSGSVLPSLVAHLIANAPLFVTEVQIAAAGDRSS
jgi:membrane protease YdiL (CAAX protease family)